MTTTDLDELLSVDENLSLYAVVDTIPGPVTVVGPDGVPEHANPQLLGYFGITLDQLKRWTTENVIHPDYLARNVESWTHALQTGSNHEVVSLYRRADGVYRWCHTRAFPLRGSDGRIARWFVLMTDIDDRKRAEALLGGENRILEMVARGHSLVASLEELCRLVESIDDGCRCAVFLADADRSRIERGVGPNMPASFLENVVGRPLAIDSAPAAMACYLNEQVIAGDLPTETRWASDWTPMALGHGVQACWATPFSSSAGQVLGAFLIYYGEPRTPTSRHQNLIEQFAHIASIAVERARNDAALIRSETRKAVILDSSLDCIITVDREGHITEFNAAAERTLGYSRRDLVGKRLVDTLVPPSVRARHQHELPRFLSGESHWLGRRIETSAMRADGSEIAIELAITRTESEGGPSFTGFLRDITDGKRAIEQRNWAETQLAGEKRLLEMIASGRSLTEVLTALCSFVEEAADRCVCGVYPIDWSGPFFHSGVAPSLPASYVDPIEGLAVRCEVAPCGIAALTKKQVIVADMESDPQWQGTPYRDHVLGHGLRSVWSTPILALDGQVLGTFAIYQREPATPSPRQLELMAQVTHIASIALERAQAESALKRSEAFLAEGERLSLTGTFSWRVTTGEITWSEQVYRIFEVDPRIPATLDLIRNRFHPDDLDVFHNEFNRAVTEAKDFEFEHRLRLPDGAVKHLRVVAHPVRDHDGRLEYIGAVQDVTSLWRSEEALGKVRSEVAHVARVSSLGTLTASIAHEVNQPLCGVVTNASTCLRMLDADPPNIDGACETARRMIRDSHRASEVIARLRALFSNKGGPLEAVDLNEATREVIALSRSELQRKGVALQADLANDLPPVQGDRVQLQQVILNLLLNAGDSMAGVGDRPRQAVVTTRRDGGDGVRVMVRDSGCGLPQQATEKIFEPFFSTKNEGMGIGLAVSRSIIERHRGRIWAAPNDGPGATFAFCIPEGH